MTTSLIPYETTYSLPEKTLASVKALCGVFKTDAGSQFSYTPTQLLIIATLAGRVHPRVQLILPTQYGKSEAVSQGILLRASVKKEKWLIVAPTKKKAEIIMGYIIKHIFDHHIFSSQLVYDEPMERLKQHKSKEHLTFKHGGEIMVLSADAKNRQRTKEVLMGFGAPNVVIDESALIDDDLYSTIKRMVGGFSATDVGTFILEIGNPFTRGHFLRTWVKGRYQRVWVDYRTALAEGRYTEDFIEEMQDEAFFDVLYECLFPTGDEVRADGYRRLLIDAIIENSFITEEPEIIEGDKPILGVDVAAGGENETVFVLRYPLSGFAKVLERNRDDDLDNQAARVIAYKKQYKIGDYRIAIDDGGVGHGLSDILKAKDILIKPVKLGEQAIKKERYLNQRAELYWQLRKWLKSEGGKLMQDNGFKELTVINYKQNASEKLQIEPKEKLRERNIPSPDTADALMLTFIDTSTIVEEDDMEI